MINLKKYFKNPYVKYATDDNQNPYVKAKQKFTDDHSEALYIYRRAMRHTYYGGIAIVLLVVCNFAVYMYASNRPPKTVFWQVSESGNLRLVENLNLVSSATEKQRFALNKQHVHKCLMDLFDLSGDASVSRERYEKHFFGPDRHCFTHGALKSPVMTAWWRNVHQKLYPGSNEVMWKTHEIAGLDIYPIKDFPLNFDFRFRSVIRNYVSKEVEESGVYVGRVELLPWGEGKTNAYKNPAGIWIDSIVWHRDSTVASN